MAGHIPSAVYCGERVQLDETTLGQLSAKQETVDAKAGAGVEGLRLQRQTGAHGSLRKGTEGRTVGQCVTTPQRTYPNFHLT